MFPETVDHHFHSAAVRKGRSPPASFAQHPAEMGENWEKPQGLGFSASLSQQRSLTFSVKKWKKTVTEMLGSSTERELVILGAVPPGSRNSVCPIPWHPDCSWHLCLDTAHAFSTSPLSRQAWSGLLHPQHRLPRAPEVAGQLTRFSSPHDPKACGVL